MNNFVTLFWYEMKQDGSLKDFYMKEFADK